MKETIALARHLEVPVINMHLSRGVYFTLPDRKAFLFDEYKEQYIKSIMAFQSECEKAVWSGGIKICVENSGGYTAFQADALSLLLKSPVFGLTFDIGHNYSIGGTDEPIIIKHADKLYHMHMNDALGKKDHLALGTGEIDLDKYLRLANQRCRRVVI